MVSSKPAPELWTVWRQDDGGHKYVVSSSLRNVARHERRCRDVLAPSLQDRTLGVLLGVALGDAFGAPFEAAVTGAISEAIAARSRRPRPWRYTDDTHMTLAVARSLAYGRTLEPSMLLATLAGTFDPALGYGHGMRRCVEAFLAGVPWEQCAFTSWSEGSAGNGAAARVAPVACRYWNDRSSLLEVAALASRVTHAHPDAIAGALLQAAAVAVALQMDAGAFSKTDFLAAIDSYCIAGWPSAKLAQVSSLLARDAGPTTVAAELGTGVLASQAVPAALWAFARGAPSFERVIQTAAQLGGDVDTICALAGALAGALCGRDALPPHWLTNLEHERPKVCEIEAIGRGLLLVTA
jgi:poly(ADP-ribose) glycohydrolase ARH3